MHGADAHIMNMPRHVPARWSAQRLEEDEQVGAERSGIEVSMAMCMPVVILELGRVATDGRIAPWSEHLMVLCHAHRRRCSRRHFVGPPVSNSSWPLHAMKTASISAHSPHTRECAESIVKPCQWPVQEEIATACRARRPPKVSILN